MIDCDRTFIGEFDFAPCDLPPGGSRRVFYYPGASTAGGNDGPILEFAPLGARPWIGMFAASGLSVRGGTCAVALPDRKTVAVLGGGAGYRVAAADPLEWEEIAAGGLATPLIVEQLELVVFLDYTDAMAYGPDGLAWRSGRLAWDDLQAVSFDQDTLRMSGYDAPSGRLVEFDLELRTGRSAGAPYHRTRPHE